MERAATSYAKFNNVNVEDEQSVPYDMIVVQPFTATDDPSVLGIKPIPNIEQKISALIEKYSAQSLDIEDIEYEQPDVMDWSICQEAKVPVNTMMEVRRIITTEIPSTPSE